LPDPALKPDELLLSFRDPNTIKNTTHWNLTTGEARSEILHAELEPFRYQITSSVPLYQAMQAAIQTPNPQTFQTFFQALPQFLIKHVSQEGHSYEGFMAIGKAAVVEERASRHPALQQGIEGEAKFQQCVTPDKEVFFLIG
jgi:hypothetical protein